MAGPDRTRGWPERRAAAGFRRAGIFGEGGRGRGLVLAHKRHKVLFLAQKADIVIALGNGLNLRHYPRMWIGSSHLTKHCLGLGIRACDWKKAILIENIGQLAFKRH